ncbi:MAG: ABC transporter ATP-binding protein [Acidimicrobiales bacterium]
MSELDITGLDKSYATQNVLRALDLTVDAGSFVSVLGPSGSGKTTLLRVIAGFERADGGCVRLRGEVVDDESHYVAAEHRRIGYVPQEGNLFPHLSVERNVGFGLKRQDRRGKRVAELLEMVGLAGFADRYPHQLSGGQQQRVALARGLAIGPSLVLLDEPFSSLDANLRATVRHDVRRILRDAGTTAILVTHDQDEALSLADRVAIISSGRVSQFDPPARLYAQPSTPEMAREFGNVNFVHGVARDGYAETPLGRLAYESHATNGVLENGALLLVLVRPEQIIVHNGANSAPASARVLDVEFYGHDAVVKLRTNFDGGATLTARTANPTVLPERDTQVGLEVVGPVVAWRRDTTS